MVDVLVQGDVVNELKLIVPLGEMLGESRELMAFTVVPLMVLVEEGEEVMLLLSRIDEHLLKHVVCQTYYLQCLHVPQCQRGYLIIGNPFLCCLGSLAP